MIAIRPARLSDLEELARVHVEAWNSVPGLPESPSLDRRLELWGHLLGGGARRVQAWVALDAEGKLVGFASAGRPRILRETFDGEITTVYVAPDAQRRGVGSALVREVLAHFGAEGISTVMVWVPEAGGAAEFFRTLGAAPLTDRRLLAHGRVTVAEVAMGWRTFPA